MAASDRDTHTHRIRQTHTHILKHTNTGMSVLAGGVLSPLHSDLPLSGLSQRLTTRWKKPKPNKKNHILSFYVTQTPFKLRFSNYLECSPEMQYLFTPVAPVIVVQLTQKPGVSAREPVLFYANKNLECATTETSSIGFLAPKEADTLAPLCGWFQEPEVTVFRGQSLFPEQYFLQILNLFTFLFCHHFFYDNLPVLCHSIVEIVHTMSCSE